MFYVYILKCSDDTLYTGYAKNIGQRVEKHNAGLGAKYTRGRLPVKLVYSESFEKKGEAMSREYKIKQMNKKTKEALYKGN